MERAHLWLNGECCDGFSRLDLLEYDKVIAGTIDFIGILCMGLALVWGGALLWRQHQMLS